MTLLDAFAVVIAATFVLSALIRQQPIGGAGFLLVLGVPLLFGGQLWAIVVVNGRIRRRSTGKGWRRVFSSSGGGSLQDFFNLLPGRMVGLVSVIFVAGWLSGVTAFPSLSKGGTSGGDAGCPYRLNNHGDYTCVSKARYEQVGAAEQRLVAGITMGFFVAHFGVAYSELLRRRGVPPLDGTDLVPDNQ